MSSTSDGPRAGWYPDPHDQAQERYWDGEAWTERRKPATPTSSPDDTAVMPRADVPVATGNREPTSERRESGSRGWVAALVGLLVGLVAGGTAGVVLAGNGDDSSSPAHDASSVESGSTVTATTTVTADPTATPTVTQTVTATATVTVTASP